ncbi:MAG: hypothetical protein MJZ20_12770 [Bacteroidaceae bacterium]|nr:hypothetical protein [Bacteroidaceae bacterium]
MAIEKGRSGNPNGRPKGTPNKATKETREWLAKLIAKNQKQIERDLKALEPKDRLIILEKFMQYTTPKMQSVAATIDIEKLTDEQLGSVIDEITEGIEI